MRAEPILSPLRITLADDHSPTRAGVRRALEMAGWKVCGEASDAKGATTNAEEYRPDVVLLDIHMPGGGVAAAEKVSAALPDSAVVMLTLSRNGADLFTALHAGLRSTCSKTSIPIVCRWRSRVSCAAALPRNLVPRLMEEFRGRGRRRMTLPNRQAVSLTSREWEVLELMGEGKRIAEIADRLQVSAVTVRAHVSAILRKLHVKERAEAVKLLAER